MRLVIRLRLREKKNLLLSNELINAELPPGKILKADVSSVSPSSERIEKLWRVIGLHENVEQLSHWWKYGHMNLWINYWNAGEAFISPVWRESVTYSWKMNFCSTLLRLSLFPWFKNSPQIVRLCWEWLGILNWRATVLDASVSFFSCLVGVRGSGPPIFSMFRLCRSSYRACRLWYGWNFRRCI